MADRIVQFGTVFRDRVDDVAYTYNVEFYDATTATWKTLVTIDDTGNLTTSGNITAPNIYGNKCWYFNTGAKSLTVGTGGTAASTTILDITTTNYKNLLPLAVTLTVGGTVATGETVTVELYAVDNDGTEYGPLASYSVTGSTGSTTVQVDFTKLISIVDGNRIVKLVGKASSSATSTSATASITVVGLKF